MGGSDPPSPAVLAALHYLQDKANYIRSYPATTSDAYKLQWYFIRKLLGWPVRWPLPQISGWPRAGPEGVEVAGVTSIRADAGAPITGAVTLASGTNIALSEAGQTITVATVSPLPGAELAYTEFTSDVVVSSTNEAAPTDVVSSGAVTYDGTAILVEFYSRDILMNTTAGGFCILNLWDGSTDLGRMCVLQTVGGSPLALTVIGHRRLTPTAASHTYKIRGWQSGGNCTVQAGAGGAGTGMPGFIRVTKV